MGVSVIAHCGPSAPILNTQAAEQQLTWSVIDVLDIVFEVGVLVHEAVVALEVHGVDVVEAYEGGEQPHICLRQAVACYVPLLAQNLLTAIQRCHDVPETRAWHTSACSSMHDDKYDPTVARLR